MIIKNKDPLFSQRDVLIVRDYLDSNVIRLVPASLCGHSFCQVKDDYKGLEENNSPFGKIIGWHRRSE